MSVEEGKKNVGFHLWVNSCDVVPTAALVCGSQTHSLESVRAHETMRWRGSQCWEVTNSSGVVEQLSRRESMGWTRWVGIKALPDRAGQTNQCVLSCCRSPAVQEGAWRKCKQTWDLWDKAAINWIRVLLPVVESDFWSSTASLGGFLLFILREAYACPSSPLSILIIFGFTVQPQCYWWLLSNLLECHMFTACGTHAGRARWFPPRSPQTASSAPQSPGRLVSTLKLDRYSHHPPLKADAWRRSG